MVLYGPQTKILERRKMWVRPFVITFHAPNYSIWSKSDEKCLQNALVA
jgi:hypothetical protein